MSCDGVGRCFHHGCCLLAWGQRSHRYRTGGAVDVAWLRVGTVAKLHGHEGSAARSIERRTESLMEGRCVSMNAVVAMHAVTLSMEAFVLWAARHAVQGAVVSATAFGAFASAQHA